MPKPDLVIRAAGIPPDMEAVWERQSPKFQAWFLENFGEPPDGTDEVALLGMGDRFCALWFSRSTRGGLLPLKGGQS